MIVNFGVRTSQEPVDIINYFPLILAYSNRI